MQRGGRLSVDARVGLPREERPARRQRAPAGLGDVHERERAGRVARAVRGRARRAVGVRAARVVARARLSHVRHHVRAVAGDVRERAAAGGARGVRLQPRARLTERAVRRPRARRLSQVRHRRTRARRVGWFRGGRTERKRVFARSDARRDRAERAEDHQRRRGRARSPPQPASVIAREGGGLSHQRRRLLVQRAHRNAVMGVSPFESCRTSWPVPIDFLGRAVTIFS